MKPDDTQHGTLLPPLKRPKDSSDLEILHPPVTIEDPRQPHCADHSFFHPECAVCKQACANFQPYPLRPGMPPSRPLEVSRPITETTFADSSPLDSVFDEIISLLF